jgi:hypothetical protein
MKNQYKTKDLAEAAALIVEGQQLTCIERDGRICWFIFENKEFCESLSNRFFFGGLLVNAREYYETMNRLKNRIFST